MDKIVLLKMAYSILEKVTPTRLDCGKLCDKACCQGEDEDTGMILYPGEEKLLASQSDWLIINDLEGLGPLKKLAVCKKPCPRSMRPLACRVFPLTPYLTEDDILLVKIDPRARGMCPLARTMDKKELDPNFIRAVRKAINLVAKNHEIRAYIYFLSRMLDEYEKQPYFV
ncbi:MAG: hypothetical protein WAP98_09765 [Caldicoprobacterales bacterium]|jgi:hypothetical protein|nr:hypothetical protein [Clostridia bacterium]